MINMKKLHITALAAAGICCLLLAYCCTKTPVKPDPSPKEEEEEITLPKIEVSSLKKTSDGKVYLEVDGKPFPLFGAQIRLDILKNCDKMSDADIEKYFISAKRLNVNCVQVPVTWNMIEPEEGKYDYSMAYFIMRLANRYNLKVELLWFGTDMIGESFTYLVPSYVFAKNEATMKRGKENQFHNLYGYYHAVIFDNPWVLERECKAVTNLFNHIREWDEKNGKKHPVITCQLHNEIDGLMRYKMINDSFTFRDGTPLTQERAWSMSLNAVDAIGKAVKNSLYKVVTRVNYMSNSSSGSFPQYTAAHATDALKYEGVDFISVDPYMDNINKVADVVESYTLPEGNYPLVAENRGYYDTTPSLILATAALGGGYDIYDLATSKFIYDNNQMPFKEEGVLTYDLKDRAHTPLTRAILKGLTAAGEDVALVATENFVPFNIKKSLPETVRNQTISTTGAKFTISTRESSIGFILDRGSYLLMYFTAPTSVTVSNGVTEDGKTDYDLEGGKLFKVGFESAGKLTSTTRSCIGTR